MEVRTLFQPMREILAQISERIDRGEYTLIIGDDASGRIPTLIMREALGALQPDRNASVKTLFITGSGTPLEQPDPDELEPKRAALRALLDREAPTPDRGRILIVTDTINTGSSLRPLCEELRAIGYNFDIAAVANLQAWDRDTTEHMEHVLGVRIYAGFDDLTPLVYGRTSLSGVSKHPEELHARAMRGESRKAADARADAHVVAQELIAWYRKTGKQSNT